MPLARACPEPEADRGPAHRRMPVAHGGRAERVVEPRVLVVADAHQGELEQPHAPPRAPSRAAGPRSCQVACRRARRMRGQGRGERRPSGRTSSRRGAPPARVVAVLLATARVAAGGLDVAVRVRADPDVGPGRRDRERLDLLDASPRSRIVAPSGSRYEKPRPARRRVMPAGRPVSSGGRRGGPPARRRRSSSGGAWHARPSHSGSSGERAASQPHRTALGDTPLQALTSRGGRTCQTRATH